MDCITKRSRSLAMIAAAAAIASLGATAVSSIDFKNGEQSSVIEITGDGPIQFSKQENPQDNQVVLELQNSSLAKGAGRKLDTSSFKSKVSLISPYQVEGQPETTRVVIQLREMADLQVAQDGNTLKVTVPESGGAAVAAAPQPMADEVPAPAPAPAAPPVEQPNPPAEAPVAEAPKAKLEAFMDAKENKRFSGRPITIQVKDAEISDVFRLIGEASGFNIVVGEDVRGKISVSLIDVPWDQALDVILNTKQLGAERNNNILRIVTLKSLTEEKQAQLAAKKAAEANAPRVTKVFPISYAKLGDLKRVLETFGTSQEAVVSGGGSNNTLNAKTTTIDADDRTNSIIVRDIPENVEKMRKLIELLDTQTPQVMVEAKVVEANEQFSKNISGSLGIGFDNNYDQAFASFDSGNPLSRLLGSAGVFPDGRAAASAASSARFGFSPNVSFIPGVQRLNAVLNIGESESQVKVVSSPKIVVLNKETATIMQGTPVLVPTVAFQSGVGSAPATEVQSADISLKVTPTVTNDGSVLMKLDISRGVPFSFSSNAGAIAKREISTQVVVESGSTLVIGGMYTMTSSESSGGFPFLRKLPIVGALFGSENSRNDRSELFIFITPRIVNEREAGLTT